MKMKLSEQARNIKIENFTKSLIEKVDELEERIEKLEAKNEPRY